MAATQTLKPTMYRPYSETPTTLSGWNSAPWSGGGTIPAYTCSGDRSAGTYTISEAAGYASYSFVAYGSTSSNRSFNVYLRIDVNSSTYYPYLFKVGSNNSTSELWAGSTYKIWKIATISSTEIETTFNALDDKTYYMVGLDGRITNYDSSGAYLEYNEGNTTVWAPDDLFDALSTSVKLTTITHQAAQMITTETIVEDSVTLGQTSISMTATASITSLGYMYIYESLTDSALTSGSKSSITFSGTLDNSLEEAFDDAVLRKSGSYLYVKYVSTGARLVYINNTYQSNTLGIYDYYDDTFTAAVDTTRVPTISSAVGVKTTNHNSQYVMLLDGNDAFDFTVNLVDNSYPNTSGTFALYLSDIILTNSFTRTEGTDELIYTGSYGPLSVNPAVNLEVNQTFTAVYQDRFGRQASKDFTLTVGSSSIAYQRFYNYTTPTWGISGTRVDEDGVVDDVNGTYIQIDYNWGLSLLDYSLSPHTGTQLPTLVITNNQSSDTQSYTLSTASGTGTYTLSGMDIDTTYAFYATLTDAAGRTYTTSFKVASGEVFMDFMAGGSGLGIGKRAEEADKVSIGWDTEMIGNLNVQGTISGPTITEIYEMIGNSGGSSSGGEEISGSATTELSGSIVDGITDTSGYLKWRGYAIPYSDLSGGTALVMLTSKRSMSFSATPVEFTLPYTFVYNSATTNGYTPVVLVNAHTNLTSSLMLWGEVTSATTLTITPSSSSYSGTAEIIVIGLVENFYSTPPLEAVTTLELSGSSSGGVTTTQVEALIKAALADYPNGDTVANMIADFITYDEAVAIVNASGGSADKVTYSGTTSGLSATTVQDAIDEVVDEHYNKTEIDALLAEIPSADTAIATANEALTLATSASSDASEAKTLATAASTDASEAKTIAEEAKAKIDEVVAGVSFPAEDVSYDDTTTSLGATDVQSAIEALYSLFDGLVDGNSISF